MLLKEKVKIPREYGILVFNGGAPYKDRTCDLGLKSPSVSMHLLAVNLPDRCVIRIRIQLLDRVEHCKVGVSLLR